MKTKKMGAPGKKHIMQLLKQYCKLLEHQQDISFSIYDDDYHLKVYRLENKILSLSGLPDKVKYYHYLYNQTVKTLNCEERERIVDKKLMVLSNNQGIGFPHREEYHSTVKENSSISEIEFPDFLNAENGYALFLYKKLLIKNGSIDESILAELKKISQLKCTEEIYLLCFDNNFKDNPVYRELKQSGLEHLEKYLQWYHDRKKS